MSDLRGNGQTPTLAFPRLLHYFARLTECREGGTDTYIDRPFGTGRSSPRS